MAKHAGPKEIDSEITKENCGEMVRLILEHSKMTLSDLAKTLGVERATLANIVPPQGKMKTSVKLRDAPEGVMNGLRAISLVRPKDQSQKEAEGSPRLTAAAVIAGLAVLARTKHFKIAAIIGGGLIGPVGLVAGAAALTYGVIEALGAIRKKNEDDFDIKPTDDSFEIVPKKDSENEDQ